MNCFSNWKHTLVQPGLPEDVFLNFLLHPDEGVSQDILDVKVPHFHVNKTHRNRTTKRTADECSCVWRASRPLRWVKVVWSISFISAPRPGKAGASGNYLGFFRRRVAVGAALWETPETVVLVFYLFTEMGSLSLDVSDGSWPPSFWGVNEILFRDARRGRVIYRMLYTNILWTNLFNNITDDKSYKLFLQPILFVLLFCWPVHVFEFMILLWI